MGQTPPPLFRRLLSRALVAAGRRFVALALVICAVASVEVRGQGPAALLVQGPSSGLTNRFDIGESLEWQLRGEAEFWRGTLVAVYPEANAIRVNDLLLPLKDVAALRFPKREGWKTFARIQGLVNLGIIGLAAAFDSDVRENQKNFAIGAAGVSAAMVVVGSIDRTAVRKLNAASKYRLVLIGGEYRVEEEVPLRPAPRY